MDRLITVREIADRYGCSMATARRYARRMPHYENPIAVPRWAFDEWERNRESSPMESVRTIVPRKRG